MSKVWRFRVAVAAFALFVICGGVTSADAKKKPKVQTPLQAWETDPKFDLVVDKISLRELLFVKNLKEYSPMVETYIQNMRTDKDLGSVPVSDQYFLGRVKLQAGVNDTNYLPQQMNSQDSNYLQKMFASMKLTKAKKGDKKSSPSGGYMSDGFAQMILMDATSFDRQHYDFRFVRRDFLGDVRTLVIDVKPKQPQTKAMFIGRIWVEDEEYNVVRFNGTYTPNPKNGEFMHFDSWRLNMGKDQWLPAYVYSEETDLTRGKDHWNFRAQTLLWGYDVVRSNKNGEFTDIVVDSDKVKDQTNSKQDVTTVEAQRDWERQAEDNVLDRMQRAALLAPEGDVDKVLNTVVQNLEVTNNLEVAPEVRCRVLLTQPMESLTIGHTIVVSRGLLDALPDEASLAAVLAHELSHIVLGHGINEKYAFSDRMIFPDETTISKIAMQRTPAEEKDADAKAVQLLQNSPYKDKLASAGLFFAAMQSEAPQLPNLIKGQFSNSLLNPDSGVRMASLVSSAPALQSKDLQQIAALPLGGRIKLDPWSDQLSIKKTQPVRLMSASEKMPFEVTPMFPYLTRWNQSAASQAGAGTDAKQAAPAKPSAEVKAAETPTPPPPQQQPQPQPQ
jgi:Peptidase family M48